MIEDATKLILPDPANIGRGATKIGEAGDGIGDRSARHFGCRAHRRIDFARAIEVHQRHGAAHGADLLQKCVIDVSQHVDDGIADAEQLDGMIHNNSRAAKNRRIAYHRRIGSACDLK